MKYRYYEKDGAVFRQKPGNTLTIHEVKQEGTWVPYEGDGAAPVQFGNEITADEAGEREGDFGETEDSAGRDPHDFYDFAPFKKASQEYLDKVIPDYVKVLIEKRRKAHRSE
jgi:hypothetical protein